MSRVAVNAPFVALLTAILLVGAPEPCLAGQPRSEGGAADDPPPLGLPILPVTDRSVRISLEDHRLYVLEGGEIVWSSPIGTGTGSELRAGAQRWDFSTPTGEFRIQYKEMDPVWVLPDWVFVERGEPIPPWDDPTRWVEDELGAAALYLTREIAIHGTDRPDLLGSPVSHGCIRMSNQDVLRLYQEVEVGTPVIID